MTDGQKTATAEPREEAKTPYVDLFEEFFRERYMKNIERLAQFYPEPKSLGVDFQELDRFNPDIADDLIRNPDKLIRAAEQAISNLGVITTTGEGEFAPNIRFFNLPQEHKVLVRDINSAHINKLLSIDGVITKITDVRPRVQMAVFECLHCGRSYRIPQSEEKFGKLTEPTICSCERKNFILKLEESSFVDVQKAQIQEPLEAMVRGEQAKTIDVWLEDDLTNRVYPGDKIEIAGVLRLRPPKFKGSVYNIFIDTVDMQEIELEFEEIEITPEEEEKIKEMAKDPQIYDKIVSSIAPTIYGYDEIKEAMILQLFSGSKGKVFPDGTKIRPDIHVLLIGDPGTAKSQLLYYIYNLAPKGVFVGGKSATGAGLTATAEKDEFAEGGWTLKAGALVLASGGLAAVDEFDKMSEEDRSSMHEAMEQQRISIAKAGIVTAFRSETAILAAANPKFGRFDPYGIPAEQFNIPPTLLSRFDLIFPIKDVMDEEKDSKLAMHILMAHQAAGIRTTMKKGIITEKELEEAEKKITPVFEPKLLRKYIAYARKYIKPVLSTEAMEKLQNYYLDLRKMGEKQGAVPTTPRQLEALVRLAEASSKGRLSDVVELEDAERAIRLNMFVMREIGMDQETGRFDIDIIATGKPKSRVDKMRSLYNLVKRLNEEYDEVTHDMIVGELDSIGVNVNELDALIQELKKSGDIYTPRSGLYRIASAER